MSFTRKFNNRRSIRLRNYDYSKAGLYFVTICCGDAMHCVPTTTNHEFCFGKIENHEMLLSELGEVAETEWKKTIEIRPDMNLQLGEFRVMPNHFHGIICIGENQYNRIDDSSLNKFGPQSKNLSSIIRGFKSAVTTYARINKIPFQWQSRFHKHITHDEQSYQRISEYIINNPKKWKEDSFFKG